MSCCCLTTLYQHCIVVYYKNGFVVTAQNHAMIKLQTFGKKTNRKKFELRTIRNGTLSSSENRKPTLAVMSSTTGMLSASLLYTSHVCEDLWWWRKRCQWKVLCQKKRWRESIPKTRQYDEKQFTNTNKPKQINTINRITNKKQKTNDKKRNSKLSPALARSNVWENLIDEFVDFVA